MLRRSPILAPPPQAAPPASLPGFCRYFLAEHRAIFIWLFACGFGVALADALVAVFIGKMVAFVGQADRWAAWNERWAVLVALLLMIGLIRPILIWLDLHLRNGFLIPGVTSRMRWISHWHVVRQSWSFFQGDSPGRLAHWGDIAGSDIALWALYPSRRLLNARVSAFLEHLQRCFPRGAPEELAAYQDKVNAYKTDATIEP